MQEVHTQSIDYQNTVLHPALPLPGEGRQKMVRFEQVPYFLGCIQKGSQSICRQSGTVVRQVCSDGLPEYKGISFRRNGLPVYGRCVFIVGQGIPERPPLFPEQSNAIYRVRFQPGLQPAGALCLFREMVDGRTPELSIAVPPVEEPPFPATLLVR